MKIRITEFIYANDTNLESVTEITEIDGTVQEVLALIDDKARELATTTVLRAKPTKDTYERLSKLFCSVDGELKPKQVSDE